MRLIISRTIAVVSLIVAVWPVLGEAGESDSYSAIRSLLLNGHAAEAQEKLSTLPTAEKNTVQFNYLSGIAARDMGRLDEAQDSFQRVLTADATHLPARVELARVYFERGDYTPAEREFENVLRRDPPADVATNVKKFLVAISHKRQNVSAGSSWNAFIAGDVGYDSNLNAATSDRNVVLPVFNNLTFTLADLYTKQDGVFWQIRGGASMIRPMDDTTAFFASAGGQFRQSDFNSSVVNTSLDSFSLDVAAGLIFRQGNDQWYAGARTHDFWAGRYHYLDSLGADVSWSRPLDKVSSVSAFGSFTPMHYHQLLAANDVDQWVGGVSYARILDSVTAKTYRVSGYVGNETPKESFRDEIGRNFLGLRLNGDMKIAPDWSANGQAAIEYSEYGAQSPIFLRTRTDTRLDLKLGLSYTGLGKDWFVMPEVTFTDNNSNIVLNAYQRTTVTVSVRHDFH